MFLQASRQLEISAAIILLMLSSQSMAEMPESLSQQHLNALVQEDPQQAFIEAFEAGDELTEAAFTAERGVGARVSETGSLFTRFPRADLKGSGEWATHVPARETGPVAQACIACHSSPYANGAGPNPLNGVVDPLHTGDPNMYLHRNTPHLFALGAVQLIAEEMTAELLQIQEDLEKTVCSSSQTASVPLSAKGISFGMLTAMPVKTDGACTADFDSGGIVGVDEDLVVKMFGWKGSHATIRAFTRHAAHNELGMQADEIVGELDGDHDGVTGELSVGDLTALTVYMAALERPISKLELAESGLLELSEEEKGQIESGRDAFAEIGCASCHVPELTVQSPVFSEPSSQVGFFEEIFPSGQKAAEQGLSQVTAIRFDLTDGSPNNHVALMADKEINLGAFPANEKGEAVIAWYSDFKRHNMGSKLADAVDVHGFGASVWPTRSLAGVGSTAPWLHNGNATTLDEAIRAHGGEADESRVAYEALAEQERAAVIAFLENLIIIDLDPEEEEE